LYQKNYKDLIIRKDKPEELQGFDIRKDNPKTTGILEKEGEVKRK
jgi:hypothetical protein